MAKIYTWRFRTRIYELDTHSCVTFSALTNYMQEAAMQASASNGYDYEWYQDNNRVWVARTHSIRYFAQPRYLDELEMRTWVSDYRRVQSFREYELRRTSDNAPILRGRTNWVYVDTEKLRPQRAPDNFVEAFQPDETTMTPLDNGITAPVTIDEPLVRKEERRVHSYEIDAAGHVNNAVYIQWGENALAALLRGVGWAAERFAGEATSMSPVGREINYFRGALEGETLRLETKLAQVGGDRATFETTMYTIGGDLVARDVVTRSFADANGPRSIPDTLYLALTRRS